MEDFQYFEDKARQYGIPENERLEWIQKKMDYIEKKWDRQPKLKHEDNKLVNHTSESHSSGDALTDTKSSRAEQKKNELEEVIVIENQQPETEKTHKGATINNLMEPGSERSNNEHLQSTIDKPQPEIEKTKKKSRWPKELKRKVIAENEDGVSETNLASKYKLPRSTISTWIRNKEKIMSTNSKEEHLQSTIDKPQPEIEKTKKIETFANTPSSQPKTKEVIPTDVFEKTTSGQPNTSVIKLNMTRMIGPEKKTLFDLIIHMVDWESAVEEMRKKGYNRTSTQLKEKIRRQLNKKNKKKIKTRFVNTNKRTIE